MSAIDRDAAYDRRRQFRHRGWTVVRVIIAAALASACGSPPAAQGPPTVLAGEGATFPVPLYERWGDKMPFPDIKLEYRPTGSGAGIDAILVKRVDFAGSEAPVSDDQMTQSGPIIHIPLTIAPIAVAYSLAAAPDELKLTGEVLAEIFLGSITRWDDRRIAQLNPGVTLPATKIVVVCRGDSSGTTKVFTEYLSAVRPEWRQRIGSKTKLAWPVGILGNGNHAVSDIVRRTEGAIGYMSLAFARVNRLKTAHLMNRANRYVPATLDGATAAAAEKMASVGDDLRVSLVDGDGELTYPITGFSYLLVPEEVPDARKALALKRFITWALEDGQAYAPGLGYATLPPEMVRKGLGQIARLRHDGQPIPGSAR